MPKLTRSRPPRPAPAKAAARLPTTSSAPLQPVRSRIEIPPALAAGSTEGRDELLLIIRVAAVRPVSHLSVLRDNELVCHLRFGADHQPHDLRYALVTTLQRLRTGDAVPWEFDVLARHDNGELERASFRVAHDGGEEARVVHGPTDPTVSLADPMAPAIVHVEHATLDDASELLIRGWAIGLTPVETVQVFGDEQPLGSATTGIPRPDITAWRPAYPNVASSGFALTKRLNGAEPPSMVRVQAVAGGLVHAVVVPVQRISPASLAPTVTDTPSAPVLLADDGRREIKLFCDDAVLTADGRLRVSGWAVSATGITDISVSLDGSILGAAELGLSRDDVGDEFITIPMARYSGFRWAERIPEPLEGIHQISIIARNGLGEIKELLRPLVAASPTAPAAVPAAPVFRVEIDSPTIIDGVMTEPVTGRLTIDGWALCRTGISGIDVLLDGKRLDEAHYGLARQDVGRAFPDWPGSLRSGYAFHCPPRLLRNGRHVAELHIRARTGEILVRSFSFEVRKPEGTTDGATIRRQIPRVEANAYKATLDRCGVHPEFRLVLRLPRGFDPDALMATLAGLRSQAWGAWRVIGIVDAAAHPDVQRAIAERAPDLADRIDLLEAARMRNWPGAKEAANPFLFGFLSVGDELGCDALAEIAVEYALLAAAGKPVELLYADESRISPVSSEREPFFKPDFSPNLLLACNYIGRPWFVTTGLLRRAGVTQAALFDTGEYDAILRCAEVARGIAHISKLLCRRGQTGLDPPAVEQAALAKAAARRGIAGEFVAGRAPGAWRLKRAARPLGKVSIIIPTCAAGGFIETCIKSLRGITAYRDFAIVCIENIPPAQMHWRDWLHDNADIVIPAQDAFNWSRFNNIAAAASSGEYLLFLNDDIEIEQEDWLDAMLEQAVRPGVGVVGARLLYPARRVQHAGMFLSTLGLGRHAFRGAAEDDPGYFGLALTERDVTAVTGACLLTSRALFEELGGFNEAHQVINNDLDFCLRAQEAGRSIVYTPHATLIHHERASRGELDDVYDLGHFQNRWRLTFAKGDPFHNPNLSRQHDDFRYNEEPVRVVHAGHPLFAVDEIRRILVVKVDHIGDFVTALPAIRRLKQHFPAAVIHVLASPATKEFARLEPAIAEIIPFEFFHERSALGQKTVEREALNGLRRRLAPYRFDLAIDLRKHPETRHLLRASGARFLAGFDYASQFPWLDVALEWEGDRGLQPKRHHISDHLCHLVGAIATAASPDRGGIPAAALAELAAGWPLPDALKALFARPVVCIHPGAGNEMKQWPAAHFATLIDLLVQEALHVVLIGGPAEAEITAKIAASVQDPTAVRSVVGELDLHVLPGLLAHCVLFVGNDSGPKHIAAAVGIPTIGIHSGTVDPAEWGPMGEQAVAISRRMTCSPCYLNRPGDCVRELACIRQIEPGAVFSLCRWYLAGARCPPPM